MRYATATELKRVNGFFQGRQNKWSFNLGATYRETEAYKAPSGSFGDISFDDEVTVNDTDITDDTIFGFLGYDLTDSQELSFRFSRYRADQDRLRLGRSPAAG